MQLAFTEEQRQFRDIVNRFCRDQSPSARVRQQMETELGFDPVFWKQLCDEAGLCGLHVPEALGGQGYSDVELGIVMEAMGYANACGPYFSSAVLATQVLMECASEDQKREWLPPICSGQRISSLALAEPGGGWRPEQVSTEARQRDNHWVLSGAKVHVLDIAAAEIFLVVARAPGSQGPEGLSLFAVPANARGLIRTPQKTLDPTRRMGRIELQSANGILLGEAGQAATPLSLALDRAATALAAEMVGGAQALLDSAVEYAKHRVQFGRAIGSFQAIKHCCADRLLDIELARSATCFAAVQAAETPEKLNETACVAKALASDAFMQTASDTIQIHGGIGFTWENDTHLYYKRARTSGVLLGDAATYRERYVQLVNRRQLEEAT